MRPLRLAFLGTGNVAHSYGAALRGLSQTMPVSLTAVCGREAVAVQAFATRYGAARATTDLASIFDAPDIDAVVILTPIQTHEGLITRALDAGKHVFTEKTLAETPAAARTLAALADTRGLILATAPATPLGPVFTAARHLITTGQIGRPIAARAIYGWAGPDWAPWFYAPDAGPLRDLGVYALTTLTGLLGPVTAVQTCGTLAEPIRQIAGTPTALTEPDTFAVTLTLAAGCIATLLTSFSLQKLRTPGIEVYGTTGTLQFAGQDWNPQALEVWTNAAACWTVTEPDQDWEWTDGLRDFCNALLTGTRPQSSLPHALHVLDIIAASATSARSGSPVPVSSTFTPPPNAPLDRHDPHRRHK